jgi:hypothetical protein
MFCLPVSSLKTQRLKYEKLEFPPLILYVCETWSLILREEHKSSVFAKLWLEYLKGRDHSEHLDIGGRITLEWILGK